MKENENIMKTMKAIMDGGVDGIGEAANDGFETTGLPKGLS
jgi:hypothetical protein